MNAIYRTQRRRRRIIISLVVLGLAIISIGMYAALRQKKDSRLFTTQGAIEMPAQDMALMKVLTSNDIIAARFSALRKMDETYGTLLMSSNNRNSLDSISKRIIVEEKLLRNTLDSISLSYAEQGNSDYNKLFFDIVATYRSVLQDRQLMNRMRNFVKLGERKLNPDEMAMLQNQDQLQEKDNRIQSLEAMLKSLSQNKEMTVQSVVNGPSDNVILLKDNIEMQQRRIEALTASNNTLKQENEKLLKQQTEALKGVSNNETLLTNKAADLQQKIDVLNAELSLARVDCNLSRVDAAQIISNSRQRKQLLTEASGILTGLLKSGDQVVKKKAQDKITLLNQVAANSRD